MTRARLPAALALLVALGGCGRAGAPVRATRAQPAPAPAAAEPAAEGPAGGGESVPGAADEEAEEEKRK